MIPKEHLSWFEDSGVSQLILLLNSFLDFCDVDLRCPGVGIHDSQIDIIGIDSVLLELLFFQVLNTPGHIGGLSLLFMLSNLMVAVAHKSEVFAILVDQQLSLFHRSLFVGLHCHEDQVSLSGVGM